MKPRPAARGLDARARAARVLASAALAAVAAASLSGCPAPSADRSAAPSASGAPGSARPPAAAAPPSASGEQASPPAPPAAAGSASAGLPAPAPLPLVSCCLTGRAEGTFGPEKGVNARYSGDYLRRKDGERLLFPDDLISDTKELYQFARSVEKSLYQERRLRVLGEGRGFVSVEIDDRGETGASQPFFHSKCKTIDLRRGRALSLPDLLGEQDAARVLAEARQSFEKAEGHQLYRFVDSSFAVTGPPGARALRFCSPRREERLGGARFDLEVPLDRPLPLAARAGPRPLP